MGTLYEVQVFLSLVEHVVLLQQCGLSLVQLQQKQHQLDYTVRLLPWELLALPQ